ncbi:unnamed protein product [Rhizopus stolonifer]
MTQFAKPDSLFTNIDTSPLSNSNLVEASTCETSSTVKDDSCQENLSDDRLSIQNPPSRVKRRADHNATERARRESLNNKFQCLAQALPNLMNYRRPSKSQIVEKALDWVRQSTFREHRYRLEILQLQRENEQLKDESTYSQQKIQHTLSLDTNLISHGSNSSDGWSKTNCLCQMSRSEEMTRQNIKDREDDNYNIFNDKIDYYPTFEQNSPESDQSQFQPVFLDYSLYVFELQDSSLTNQPDMKYFPSWT